MSSEQQANYSVLLKESLQAGEEENHKLSVHKGLEIVFLTPVVQDRIKFLHSIMCWYLDDHHTGFPLTNKIREKLFYAVVHDDTEHIFVKACAALLLGMDFLEDFYINTNKAIIFLDLAIHAIETKEAQECLESRLPSVGGGETIGILMMKIKDLAIYKKREIEDPKGVMLEEMTSQGKQVGLTKEVLDAFFSEDGIAPGKVFDHRNPLKNIFTPPAITTDLMAKVRELPVAEKTYLVIEEWQKSLKDHDHTELPDNPNNPFLQEMKAAYRKFNARYVVVEVDLEQFHLGEEDALNVFRQVQTVRCESSSSVQKNLLGSFVVACQHPHKFSPIQEHTARPKRPQTVLLPFEDEQVKLFLGMMGCTEVEVAEPELLDFLKKTDVVELSKTQKQFPQKAFPHLYDVMKGNKCGHCDKVGPTLKMCPCGTAYYCNKACSNACWPSHRKGHKAAMKKKLKTDD